ncbi:MAG: hypothetical protein JWQ71_1547 [Pedosphaera sp.]|nr:hypothetical protein [Pedosphaera sp.]
MRNAAKSYSVTQQTFRFRAAKSMKSSPPVNNIIFPELTLFLNSSALRHLLMAFALIANLLAPPANSLAQTVVFSEDWEINHRTDNTYVTNFIASGVAELNGSTNNLADLFFDYSTVGVPLSPHSTNSSTHALKLCCNIATGQVFPTGLSVSPVGFGITENFDMHFDAWYNFDGPMPGGGPGSTEIGGAGYGTAGTNAQVAGKADSVYIGGSTDGNTTSDFRVYSSAHTISYQGGSYRIGSSGTDGAVLGDPSSGYVYAGTGGSRDSDNSYYVANYPSAQCPNAQQLLFPQQTNSNGTFPGQGGFAKAGALAFKWHDVSLSKVANVITYKIDGFVVATVDVVDAGPLGGSNILFNMYDINNGGDTQVTGTNLLFFLVDNVRITNFPNVVSVSTSNNTSIAEGSSTPGVFTITRTSSGTPLTVGYSMSGSASNGVDYTDLAGQPLSGTITFSQNATSTNISVKSVDDAIPELTETIQLNIDPSTNYTGAGNAIIRIVDNEPSQLTITNLDLQMFKRTNDSIRFQISRLGDTNAASFPVSLASSGSAVYGTDFYTNVVVTFEPGISTTNIQIFPIEDATYKGNQTVTVSIAASSGYTIGTVSSATANIISALNPSETVLFQDNFDTDTTANWTALAAANDGVPDNSILFNFDYSGLQVPASPHGNGSTLGLFMTVNKNDSTPAAAALNAYPVGQNFSGNYALRFDMWQNILPNSTITTEYVLAGLNHSGTKTNWWRSGGVPAGWTFDGVWYALETDGQASPNFVNYSSPTTAANNPTMLTAGTNSSGFTQIFKSPPWTVAGSAAVTSRATTITAPLALWSEVELSQIGNIQTLRINNSTIMTYSNATPYTAGNIMLGYLDAFDSAGDFNSYAIFDNVRVVRLNGLTINGVSMAGTNAVIDFTFDLNDSPGAFALQGSGTVVGPYTDITTGTLVMVSPTHFRATVPVVPGGSQFFRVHHN